MHTDCTCTECQRLDALPARLHGIAHAKQATFISANHDARPIDWPEVEPYRPQGPSVKPWESLPLFGTLEPDLFA